MSKISISKNIFANLVSNIWLMLLLVITTPIYVRLLGIEGYGLIGFYLSWVAIVGIVDIGVTAAAGREVAWLSARPDGRRKIPTLLRSLEVVYWGAILLIGLGILIGTFFFGKEWFQTKDISKEVVWGALMLMAIALVAQVPSGLYISGLMGLQRQVECSGLIAFFGTLRALGAVFVIWLISPDIRAFFLWQIMVSFLQTGMMRWSLWRKVRMEGYPARFSKEVLGSIKMFAGGMVLITASSIILTQADKLILSRMVSLEVMGFYMLAWTVTSGLSRIATPLIQAFAPYFTMLVSSGDRDSLEKQVRISSQLMSALILPPSALIVVLSKPILFSWTGSEDIAAGATSIMAVLVVGTAFSACSYPALSILYSEKRLRPVITVNLVSLLVLLPLLMMTVVHFGVIGAAFVWAFYGLILYVTYQLYGLRNIPKARFFSSTMRNFIAPGTVSFVVAFIAGYLLKGVEERMTCGILLGAALIVGWLAAFLSCQNLRNIAIEKLKWKWKTNTSL